MYLHALRYTVSNVNFKWKQTWDKSSSRVILGHSKPPSLPGQNQAGLDENCSQFRRLTILKMSKCFVCLLVLGLKPIVEQSVTNIFEYSNIFDPNVYSDIRLYHFLDTNIFGYSFVSTFWIRIYSDIRS